MDRRGDYPRWIDTSAMSVRLLSENYEFLPIDGNVEFWYLRHETH